MPIAKKAKTAILVFCEILLLAEKFWTEITKQLKK